MKISRVIGLAWLLTSAPPAVIAEPILRNGDFSLGLQFFTTTVVAGGSFPGYPRFVENGAPCLPSQDGNHFLAIDVPGGADGYVEQQLALPDEASTLRLRSWGHLQAVTATISVITKIDGIEHVLERFTPPRLQASPSACSGQRPVVKVYDLTPYRGQAVRVRLRATSAGYNGTIADFDDLSIVRGHGGSLAYADSVLYGPANPAVAGPPPCSAGDPVNCATGNRVETATDLFVAGRGRALRFARTYNSQAAAAAAAALGFGWSHSYAARLEQTEEGDVTVRQGDGSTVTFLPSGNGFVAPPFVIATLVRNPEDGGYTFTLPDQRAEVFNGGGVLVAQSDRNGYRTHLAYTRRGKLKAVNDAGGRSLVLRYDRRGRLASVTDPAGRRVSYGYDAAGNLAAVRDAAGHTVRYRYDDRHRLVRVTDANGGVTTHVYDGEDRVVRQVSAAGRVLEFAYSDGKTTITDGNGHAETQVYAGNRLLSRTRGAGSAEAATATFSYDDAGDLATRIDGEGNVWQASHDGRGNRLSVTDPLGRTTYFSYDDRNNLLTRTDPMGTTVSFGYDEHGNLATVSRPLAGTGQTWTLTLQRGDAGHPGDVTALTDPDGLVWKLAYDRWGNLVRREDPLGNVWRGRYNRIGWLTAAVPPRGNEPGAKASRFRVTRAYGKTGELLRITDPLGSVRKFSYDGNRHPVRIGNGSGADLRFLYDADGKPVQAIRADGSAWANAFDQAGNLTEQSDGGGAVTHYGYDALDRLTRITDPLGRATVFRYDRAGRRVAVQGADGAITTLTYDGAGQLTSIGYSDGVTPAVAFRYDGNGRRTEMTDGSGSGSYQWDSLGRLTAHSDGGGRRVGYGYDLRGNLIRLDYPNGQTVSRQFDAAGRLVAVSDWLGNTTTFHGDADGNLSGIDYSNGVVASLDYDPADRIIGIDHSNPEQSLLRLDYRRNRLGQVRRLGEEGYGYTRLNQLRVAGDTGYAYDAADNLIRSGDATLGYDAANQLTVRDDPAGHWSFAYDAAGNRLQAAAAGGTVSYRYDQANRLVAVGDGVGYGYDGDGLRVRKVVGAATRDLVWNRAEAVPALLSDGEHWFIYGRNGWPLEQVGGDGSVAWFHQDQAGSTRLLTGAAGAELARYRYSPFGELVPDGPAQAPLTPLLFAGQYVDLESGLQYLRARYYDPATAQFLSRDPLAGNTRQPYLYVNGDPLNRRDPTGLEQVVIVVNLGTWTAGTSYSAPNDEILGGQLLNGIGQTAHVGVYSGPSTPEGQGCVQEQALADAGHLASGTHGQYLPYGGNPVSYSVVQNVHTSGAASNPNSVQIVTTQVTDGQGNVVYHDQVIGTVANSADASLLQEQSAANVNAFFQGAIQQNQ